MAQRFRNLVVTLNNYSEEEYNHLTNHPLFKYVTIGKEISESGTPPARICRTNKTKDIQFNQVGQVSRFFSRDTLLFLGYSLATNLAVVAFKIFYSQTIKISINFVQLQM